MAKNNIKSPTFSTLLTDDNFTSQLQIPSDFVRSQAENLSRNVFLATKSEGQIGIVKIEKIGNHHFFTDGWRRIAQVLDLENGGLVMFDLVAKSRFEVLVYGSNGCSFKNCTATVSESEADEINESEDEDDDDGRHVRRDGISWELELTKSHANEVEIPKEIVIQTGLGNKKVLKLACEDGKPRQVYLKHKDNVIYMTTGWNQFLVEENVRVGSTILFDFEGDSTNLANIKIVKCETGGEFFPRIPRGRGRPPNFKRV